MKRNVKPRKTLCYIFHLKRKSKINRGQYIQTKKSNFTGIMFSPPVENILLCPHFEWMQLRDRTSKVSVEMVQDNQKERSQNVASTLPPLVFDAPLSPASTNAKPSEDCLILGRLILIPQQILLTKEMQTVS